MTTQQRQLVLFSLNCSKVTLFSMNCNSLTLSFVNYNKLFLCSFYTPLFPENADSENNRQFLKGTSSQNKHFTVIGDTFELTQKAAIIS